MVRSLFLAVTAALAFVAPRSAQSGGPSAAWLAQAQCIHFQEGPWNANTGNGYFGGMQFSPQTWRRVDGRAEPAFDHPGDPAFPFSVSPREQLHRAWLLWLHDGHTWRSWGAVGASCAATTAIAP
jgi:hypothetical protein